MGVIPPLTHTLLPTPCHVWILRNFSWNWGQKRGKKGEGP